MGVNGEGWVWRRIWNCSGWHRVVWKLWHEYGESRVDEEGLELGWRAYSGCKVPRNSVEAKDGYGEPDMVLFWCIGPEMGVRGFRCGWRVCNGIEGFGGRNFSKIFRPFGKDFTTKKCLHQCVLKGV